MHVIPTGATCPSTWAIPSFQPFPDKMGNKHHQCRQHLETTLKNTEDKPHASETGWDTFTSKQGKVSRSSTCCGPQLALAIGMMSPLACRNAQGVLPWQSKRGSSLPLSAEGCLARGLIRKKQPRCFQLCFLRWQLLVVAGWGLSSPRTCTVHKEVRKKQRRSNPCKLDIKNTSPVLNADRAGNANIIKAR